MLKRRASGRWLKEDRQYKRKEEDKSERGSGRLLRENIKKQRNIVSDEPRRDESEERELNGMERMYRGDEEE